MPSLALIYSVTLRFHVVAQGEKYMPPTQAILNTGFENTEWNFTSQNKHPQIENLRSLYPIHYIQHISIDVVFASITTKVTILQN